MVKTKQARKTYTCSQCEDTIQKGDRVGRRSVIIGYSGTWSHAQDCECCGGIMPDSRATMPLRKILPVCEKCSQ